MIVKFELLLISSLIFAAILTARRDIAICESIWLAVCIIMLVTMHDFAVKMITLAGAGAILIPLALPVPKEDRKQ